MQVYQYDQVESTQDLAKDYLKNKNKKKRLLLPKAKLMVMANEVAFSIRPLKQEFILVWLFLILKLYGKKSIY